VTGLLPDSGLRLNPDAAHPPFAWQVALPESWTMLDTHPATWQRSLERLVDERLAGRRLRPADRRELLSHLEELVISAQRGGVLISLVQVGVLSGGGVASAGLHLAWYDSSPAPATLATVRRAVGRQGVVEEIDTDAGTVLLQRDRMTAAVPGSTGHRGLTSLQAFLPLPGRTWTAVVATASAQPELTDLLRDLVLATAVSIQPVDEAATGPAQTPGPDDPPGDGRPAATFTPVDKPTASGIERGFGTMVLRRIDPPDDPGPG
jgi:hypothetical protein